MHKKRQIALIFSTILIILQNLSGQLPEIADTINILPFDNEMDLDYELPVGDTLFVDSLTISPVRNDSSTRIEAEIKYSARDSMIFSIDRKKIFLFGEANVAFEDKSLSADFIEYDMDSNIVFAKAIKDSFGIIENRPAFTDEAMSFEAMTIRYNFRTQRGFIETLKTEQEEGYLHSEKTRKDERGHIHMYHGKYTTCDADHPHYYIALTKAKSIPGDKIISGPAYLVIEDIPIPIGIPFGFFPNTKTNTSGILIPQYGEEGRRGFYLRNGGYYWAASDFFNLTATGDIYTNGTWGLRLSSDYRRRYKFSGNMSLRYFKNVSGYKDLDNYSKSFDYSIMWSHNQDAKANPNQSFRASVNLSTNKFDQNHSRNLTNALTNTKQSSVSFQKSWPGSPFNFSSSFNHSQNSRTGSVDLNFPKATFNMNRIYPFRSKSSVGERAWFEDIQLSYSSYFDNRIRTTDSLLFTNSVWDDMNMGFRHEIPVSWQYKPRKFRIFTLSPNLRYTGMIYRNYIEKRRVLVSEADTSYFVTVKDTINKIRYAQGYYPGISASLNPKIYGLYQFSGKGKVQSIRHVMSPTASFSYIPDMSGIVPDYYRELRDEEGNLLERYSIFQDGMFGTPSLTSRQRSMSLSLNNTLEMKVLEESDTASQIKKVRLVDNFNFSTSANFEDSIIFRPVSFTSGFSLFEGKTNFSFRGSFDPYALDETNRRINRSEFKETGKLARLTNLSFSTGISFSGGSRKTDDVQTSRPDETLPETDMEDPNLEDSEYDRFDEDYIDEYVDFSIPWSIRLDYSFSYNKPAKVSNIIQTVRVTGDFSLTPKWKIGYNTGFDFESKKLTTSSLSIYRDLHCWEMRLTAVPFGYYKSFNFQINVKSAVLKDLKYNKRIPWQDNF